LDNYVNYTSYENIYPTQFDEYDYNDQVIRPINTVLHTIQEVSVINTVSVDLMIIESKEKQKQV
jgi:hypothetical protein